MSRTGLIALCTISLIAFGVAGAAESPFGSARITQVPNGGELPSADPMGVPPSSGTWDKLNSLPTTHMVTWGDRLAVSFEGFPGLWLYEDGGWEQLAAATPQHLIVACRGLVASFQGYGVFLHDGQSWIPLNGNDAWTLEAWGDENILINFAPGVGFWNFECPTSITCAFLDGATWQLVDVANGPEGPYTSQTTIQTEVVGDMLYLSFYENGECQEEIEEFELNNDCSFAGDFFDEYQLGPPWACTATNEEFVSGRFTEDQAYATFYGETTHFGESCPEDYFDEGVSMGVRCDPEVCWPCDEPF